LDIVTNQYNLSPIAIFVYNRTDNLKNLFDSLLKNKEAKDTILYIFSDGPKGENDLKKVNEVRKFINSIEGFKKIEIIESTINKGLAKSIIEGVTKVINIHGKIIVLEDDLIVSNVFIEYMNKSLEKFKGEKIWSISAYSPRIDFPQNYLNDFYITMRACSWGWATWKKQWDTVTWEIEINKNKKLKKAFNQCGTDMYNMLLNQEKGYIDSWAIRWCYSQFIQKKYTIYPKKSLLRNEGLSKEGTHGSINNHRFNSGVQNSLKDVIFLIPQHNKSIQKEFNKAYDLKFINYIGIFLRAVKLYSPIKKMYKKIRRII